MIEPEPMYNSYSPNVQDIAKDFQRWGWFGFWIQTILGSAPILLLLLVLFVIPSSPSNRQNSWLGLILGFSCLFALLFTLYWCYRYAEIGRKLENPEQRPPKAEVIQGLKIGVIVNLVGMACIVLVGFSIVGTLLYKILTLPPGASRITRTAPGATIYNPGAVITPFNLIAIQAMINGIAAELVGVSVSLWLLNRVNQHQSK